MINKLFKKEDADLNRLMLNSMNSIKKSIIVLSDLLERYTTSYESRGIETPTKAERFKEVEDMNIHERWELMLRQVTFFASNTGLHIEYDCEDNRPYEDLYVALSQSNILSIDNDTISFQLRNNSPVLKDLAIKNEEWLKEEYLLPFFSCASYKIIDNE